MQALIVDDFESFRITLSKMLQDFGIGSVDSASSGTEALRYCDLKAYDIILCDQNLGKGKTGQQILEVLRHQPNLNSDSLFVLVSAESNKSIIMAAYDYEPDAYLTKPITAQTLRQRLERLFRQRISLAPIYKALKKNDLHSVVALCEAEIATSNRFTNVCQKILGRVFLQLNELEKAENVYRNILEVRQLDWAMLGMAQVKKLQGDALSAQHWLEEIIQFNPLCLKAYDLLAQVMAERNDLQGQQKVLQQAVDISPLSIVRQQMLGDVAVKNNDVITAANSYRKAVRLGENSCHDDLRFHEDFVRTGIQYTRLDKNAASGVLRDALKVAAEIPQRFGKTNKTKISSYLLESQLFSVAGEERRSTDALLNAQKIIDSDKDVADVDIKIELVKTLRALGHVEKSDKIVAELLSDSAGNEDDLQKVDCLLHEPCSAKNKAMVAKINSEGIAFYEAKDFSKAVDCFTRALRDLPQNIGLRLNLLQALLGQFKQHSDQPQLALLMQSTIDYIQNIIPQDHEQLRRFRQLEDSFRLATSTHTQSRVGLP
ncbi:MAG: response regulator [Gammaproteobacteria bacterium]|nr:MAG: response regulator [Gammaproteobacteria bacterium]